MLYLNKILFIVKDKNILLAQSNFQTRHKKYISSIKNKKIKSEFLLIQKDNLFLIDENFTNKINFNNNYFKLIYFIIKNDYKKIILQDTFIFSLLINIISKFKKFEVILQIHGEIFSKKWILLNSLNIIKFFLTFLNILLAKKIRVVNEYTKKVIIKNFKNKIVCNIPIPILDTFEKKTNIYSGNEFTIIYVSELTSIKNPELAVKICNELSKLKLNFKMFIVGDGILKNKIRSMIDSLNLDKHIIMLGQLDYKEIKEILKKANLSLITSKTESYSRVIVESFLNHTPVVSTNSTGPSELVKNKYLFEINQEKLIANCIYNLLNNNIKL